MTDLQLRGPVDLTTHRYGQPQRTGDLTMVPLFGPAYPGIAPPRSAIKLARVDGYGRVVLSYSGTAGVAIVPLHMGFIQDGAQNHALCRSAFLAAGQELLFPDAACVQASQGGFLTERDQWFFILPVELRAHALDLRGTANYAKLWPAISTLNRHYGLPDRGHLEQVLSGKRAELTQYQSWFELQPEQLGALFFLGGRLAGVEIAPDPRYFAEVWMPLVCFAYGTAAWHASKASAQSTAAPTYDVSSVAELRAALEADRRTVDDDVRGWIVDAGWQSAELAEEERFLDMRLCTVVADDVAGQVVVDGDRLVYASLFDRRLAC